MIEFSSGAPKGRRVHHVVERIVIPFAVPIEDRPAVMSREERQAERERRWAEKYVRRESRRLGTEVDLASLMKTEENEKLSTAEMIHRIHRGKERVGKIKALVERRLAKQESQAEEDP